LLIFLALGFPIALLLAWAYELTPAGIKLTAEVDRSQSTTRQTGQRMNLAIIALLIVAVVFMFVDNYLPAGSRETTIAVLPFTNLSAEADNNAFIDGFVVELHNSLTQIEDLRVTALTSSMTYRDTNLNAPRIAAELGVDYLLEGGVARGADDLRVIASLIRGEDGSSVWSNPYDRELNDPQALQLELAEAVAERLSVTFGVGDFEPQAGGTTNLDAYDHFLEARGWLQQDATQDALSSYELALSLDPDFGLAQIGLASLRYALLRVTGSR
jgi:TolB-like protein